MKYRVRLSIQQVSAAGTAAAKPPWMDLRRPAEETVVPYADYNETNQA